MQSLYSQPVLQILHLYGINLSFNYYVIVEGIHCHSSFQGFDGAVMVDSFPWNDAVVVVDNETPADDFSLQPEQDVVKYGSGIVIMQTSWVSVTYSLLEQQ